MNKSEKSKILREKTALQQLVLATKKANESIETYKVQQLATIERKYQTKLRNIQRIYERDCKNEKIKEKNKNLKKEDKKPLAKPLQRKVTNLRNECCKIRQMVARLKRADHVGMCQCISCNEWRHWKSIDGGHYIDKSQRTEFDFDIMNIRPQCRNCNGIQRQQKNGNKGLYRKNLTTKIGEIGVLFLEARSKKLRSRQEYLELIELGKIAREKEFERSEKEGRN